MADPAPIRIGVLISGSGSNLQTLIDNCEVGFIPGQIAMVISNNPDAYGITRAQEKGIAVKTINHRDHPDRDSFDLEVGNALEEAKVDLVCLAGFMRILTSSFVKRFQGRLINIHPSLLPAFPGLHVQQQAIDAGVRFSGATVHFVDEEVDTGPIIVQAVVPILPDDTAKQLAARILVQEHRIYPLSVRLFARGQLKLKNSHVQIVDGGADPDAALINPPFPH